MPDFFHLKCTKFNFRLEFRPRPQLRSSHHSTDLLAGFGENEREKRKKGIERGKGEWEG